MIAKEEINFFIFLLLTCHRIRAEAEKGVGSEEWGMGRESNFPAPTPHSPLTTPFCFFALFASPLRATSKERAVKLSLRSHFTAVPIRLHLMPVSLWRKSGALGSKERCT